MFSDGVEIEHWIYPCDIPPLSFLNTNFVVKRGDWLLWGLELGLQLWEVNFATTTLPLTAEFPISQFLYSQYFIQDHNHIHPLGGDRGDTFEK